MVHSLHYLIGHGGEEPAHLGRDFRSRANRTNGGSAAMGSIVWHASDSPSNRYVADLTRRQALTLLASAIGLGAPATGRAANAGQLTWGLHISLAPTWFDPAETSGIVTPYMVLYALHDALVKPMPGEPLAPSLAQSWSESQDGLTY